MRLLGRRGPGRSGPPDPPGPALPCGGRRRRARRSRRPPPPRACAARRRGDRRRRRTRRSGAAWPGGDRTAPGRPCEGRQDRRAAQERRSVPLRAWRRGGRGARAGGSAALAVPAYAGIPATHRDHASLVTIATGHQARPAPDAEPTVPALPWSALARQGGTLVFLMGMRQLPLIMTKLMEHGLARDTPAAVVEQGTTGRQRTVVATVATLAARVREAGLGPPGIVVVGSVVGIRERVRWFEDRPLFGRRVVLTRPRAQAGELARLLEDVGAEVILFPTIAIGPPRNPGALDRAVASAFQCDWIVFT